LDSTQLIKNKKSVPLEFDIVARKYDVATLLSQGYQKDLQLSVDRMNLKGTEYLADLCCGTGKSTQACINKISSGNILGIDNSKEMLDVANKKFPNINVIFTQEDVMELDYPENTFDAIFMAYGIRNMPDYSKCLRSLRKILKPGGVICFHEYSLSKSILTHLYWKLLGYLIIIPISSIISSSSGLYKYLVKSVSLFPSPKEFTELLTITGFKDAKRLPMPGWRRPILHTFLAHKSSE